MEPHEMRKHRLPLDSDTVDRLLDGRMDPHDAPPGYGDTAAVLHGSATGFAATEIDDELLEAMLQAIGTSPALVVERKPSRMSKLLTAKVAAVAAAAVLTTTGAAAAATGNLPDAAQDALSRAAERVGVELPASGGRTADELTDEVPEVEAPEGELEETPAGELPDDETPADDATTTGHAGNPTDADAHGAEVSEVARTTTLEGRDHGAAVSATARENQGGPNATTTTTTVTDTTSPTTTDDAPGRSGEAPGRSGEAPGRTTAGPGGRP